MFYQYQFDPNPGVFPSFALDSAQGEGVYLSAADAGGHLTGYRVGVEFGAAENGVSLGRYTNSTGVEFVALSRRTFGVDNPATLAQFRTGTGLPNAYPQVGPVVINELMYQPVTVVGTELVEQPQEEFIELYNLSTNSVALFDPNYPANTWQLSGGIAFAFPAGTVLAAQSHLLVVGFDPVADPAARRRSGLGLGWRLPRWCSVRSQGRLSNEGEGIGLYKPDAPSPAPEAGFVPWILADRVNYGITAPWPAAAAGGGASLQRRVTAEFGNDPLNWKADPPTAGRTNAPVGLAPPVIAAQPQAQTVTAGANVTFSVAAVGALPLSYRWQYNGADLFAATNAILLISNVQLANSGSYRVWVSNAAGSICSQPIALSVFNPPVITIQPLSTSVAIGAATTLQVAAAGTQPLAYQWYFNNSPLTTANGTSLVLTGVGPADAGQYRVVVTNSMGMAISYPAVLKVKGHRQRR